MVFGKMTWINWLWNTFFFSATIAKSELRCRNVLMSQTVQWGFPKLGVPQKLDALFHWKSDWIGWFRGTPMLGNLQIIVKYIPTSIIHPSSPQLTTSLLGRAVASRRQSLHLRRGGRALQGGWNPLKFSHNLHSAWWTTIILFSHTKSHHNVTMCGFSFWSDLGVFFGLRFCWIPPWKAVVSTTDVPMASPRESRRIPQELVPALPYFNASGRSACKNHMAGVHSQREKLPSIFWGITINHPTIH